MVEIVPATQAHVSALYGGSLPVTLYGVAAIEDGKLLCMGALYVENGCMVATCKIADEARPNLKRYARVFFMGWSRLRAIAEARRLPVRARPDPDAPRSAALLDRLGFVPIENGAWEWTNSAN